MEGYYYNKGYNDDYNDAKSGIGHHPGLRAPVSSAPMPSSFTNWNETAYIPWQDSGRDRNFYDMG